MAVGTKRDGPITCSGARLSANSYRMPPCSVKRSIVQRSCANTATFFTSARSVKSFSIIVSWLGTPLLKR